MTLQKSKPDNRTTQTTKEQAQARIAELVALQRIGRELNSTLDENQILNLLIREAITVTMATHGSVLLLDEQEGSRRPQAWYGYTSRQVQDLENIGKLTGRGIVNRVLTTGQVAVIDDVRQDPDYIEIVPTTRSELTVPIRHGPGIVGVIDLESPDLYAFDPDSQRFAFAIAEQAAIAIGNARRYAEQVDLEIAASRRNEQLRNLIEISRMLHSNHTLDIAGFPLNRAGEVLGVMDVSFFDEPLLVGDVANDSRHSPFSSFQKASPSEERSLEARSPETRSELAVPLYIGNEAAGVLDVRSSRANALTEEDLSVIRSLGAQLSVALENARLYDELELRVQRRTEELADALRRQALEADRTKAILESISDAVIVFDPQGTVILANPITARVLGLSAQQWIHRNLNDEIMPDLSEKDREMMAAVFRIVKSVRKSLASDKALTSKTFASAGQVIASSFTSVALHEAEPLNIVAVFRDVTREAQLDQMKSEFIAMAAHEIRTPMTSIKGYIDLLVAGIPGPVNEKQARFLQTVKANAERLMKLVNDLLDISKIESEGLKLNLQSVSLADVVAKVVIALGEQLEAKGQHLIVDVPIDLPEAMADRDRMVQVVTNLLDNAHKYTPGGGTISIQGRQADAHLELEVRDSGIGISAPDQDRLFKRFFRADNAVRTQERGAGLGLTICREIIERHGGEIQIESKLGRGSTFRIVLPLNTTTDLPGQVA
jgi:PAS domain S-box-containing protein